MTDPERNKWTTVAQYDDEVRVGNFPTRPEAQDAKQQSLNDLGADDARLFPPGEVPDPENPLGGANVNEEPEANAGNGPKVVDAPSADDPTVVEQQRPAIEDDPVDWLPSHFIDRIQGVPVVNRKGYCVLASQYGVSVVAEPETVATPEEDFAAFSATATTDDGKTYTGYGTASTERNDDAELLNELAETRAMKRAVAWATGIGMTAVEEMQGEQP